MPECMSDVHGMAECISERERESMPECMSDIQGMPECTPERERERMPECKCQMFRECQNVFLREKENARMHVRYSENARMYL